MIAGGVSPETERQTDCIGERVRFWPSETMLQWMRLMCSPTAYAFLQSQGIGSMNSMTTNDQHGTDAIKAPVLELWMPANLIRKTGERKVRPRQLFAGVKHGQGEHVYMCLRKPRKLLQHHHRLILSSCTASSPPPVSCWLQFPQSLRQTRPAAAKPRPSPTSNIR